MCLSNWASGIWNTIGATTMTNEQELLLDCWCQFASYQERDGVQKYSNMALSTLEGLEDYLQEKGLIDSNGVPIQEALK